MTIAATASKASLAREVGGELRGDELPPYAPMLAAYQRAHAAELRAMIADLPLAPGDYVLDMACGAGTYSVLLAERLGPCGRVVGVDIAPAYLALARQRAQAAGQHERISFQIGDIARLPFEDDSFDLVWCAQSMYSLPDPMSALREMHRVVRPGGSVVIFENDPLHQLVLPWPPELELVVRQAQLESLAESSPGAAKFFIGREICGAMAEAGYRECSVTPYTTARHAPLSADERIFLAGYFADLASRARPLLEPAQQDWLDRLIAPGSDDYLLDRPDFYATYIDLVARGVK